MRYFLLPARVYGSLPGSLGACRTLCYSSGLSRLALASEWLKGSACVSKGGSRRPLYAARHTHARLSISMLSSQKVVSMHSVLTLLLLWHVSRYSIPALSEVVALRPWQFILLGKLGQEWGPGANERVRLQQRLRPSRTHSARSVTLNAACCAASTRAPCSHGRRCEAKQARSARDNADSPCGRAPAETERRALSGSTQRQRRRGRRGGAKRQGEAEGARCPSRCRVRCRRGGRRSAGCRAGEAAKEKGARRKSSGWGGEGGSGSRAAACCARRAWRARQEVGEASSFAQPGPFWLWNFINAYTGHRAGWRARLCRRR